MFFKKNNPSLMVLLTMSVFCLGWLSPVGFAKESKKSVQKKGSMTKSIPSYSGLSPQGIVVVGEKAYVTSATGKKLVGWDKKSGKTFEIALKFTPVGVVGAMDGKSLFITDGAVEGKVHQYDLIKKKVVKTFAAGHQPSKVLLVQGGKTLVVLNSLAGKLSFIDLGTGERREVMAGREPRDMVASPDGKQLAVVQLLPTHAAKEKFISGKVTLFDVENPEKLQEVTLANGSQSLEGIAFSPDGKWLYVTHLISRFQYPVTQVERGWINTNALSLIDVEKGAYKGSVLLDAIDRGAANPRGVSVSTDGATVYIALAGTHELLKMDLKGVHERLEKAAWNPKVINDLTFVNDLIQRLPLGGKSPRSVVLQEGEAWLPCYFSEDVALVDIQEFKVKDKKKWGKEVDLKGVRKGEFLFFDAGMCFQNWQSCVSCHPDGRADGLNWDQQNDGMGNPKNTKSMVYSHATPPSMITAIRTSAELAVRKGIMHTLFASVDEKDAASIDQYLMSLRPEPSPFLEKGKLNESAKRGKVLYEKALCNQCHSGEYLTDQKTYDVGTGVEEYVGFAFDTPTLKEVWRTAPYLYDGRAKNLREVLVDFNKEDKHGKTSDLTEKELQDLEQYLLTL